MASRLQITDFSKKIQTLNGRPVVINDLDNITKEGKRVIKSFLFSEYQDGDIDVTKSCSCGTLLGLENVGKICPICAMPVVNSSDQKPENRLWYRKPDCIKALINPSVFVMLSDYLKVDDNNLVSWFCDRSRNLIVKNDAVAAYINDIPYERGFNSFIENFDGVIEYLAVPKIIGKKHEAVNQLKFWINYNRRLVFTDIIAIQDKSFLVLEKTGPARWSNSTSSAGVDAVYTLIDTGLGIASASERNIEKKLITFYEEQKQFFTTIFNDFLGTKFGALRKTVYGNNLALVARAVVTSLTKPCHYNEIQLPWGVAIRILRIHIAAKLSKVYGLTPNQINEKIESAITHHDPLIYEIMNTIIAEAPSSELVFLAVRYPTMYRGSMLRVICVYINPDPEVKTIGASIFLCKLMNMDKPFKLILLSLRKMSALLERVRLLFS